MKKVITWLRKPRWFTTNGEKAENSLFQWRFYKQDQRYSLSILGIINGVLPVFGICLVVVDDKYLEFRKPWW